MSSGKYTGEFFAKRIQDLQQEITSQLPSIDSTVKESFVISCAIVQSSAEAKGRALDLVRRLGWVNNPKEEAIESANNIFKACAEAHTKAEETFVTTGRSILDKLHLASSIDEAALLECIILVESTPKRLAHWVANDVPTNERLLDSFLGNVDWMKQMIFGGGASYGNYGRAIAIHSTLLLQIAADDHPATPMRHKLALATALEHAIPLAIPPDLRKNQVDPTGRFWHYVKAYENGELDGNFDKCSVWELRMVIDSHLRDETLTRSQELFKTPDSGPPSYGSLDCKARGVPTFGQTKPGDTAIARWTPSGWTVLHMAHFWVRHGIPGTAVVEEAQARFVSCPSVYYKEVTLLKCLARCLGEPIQEKANPANFWTSLYLAKRKLLASRATSQGSIGTRNYE